MKGYLTALIVALFLIFMCGISWLTTCGVVKLITLCFGWDFSWAVSTGIWLIGCLTLQVFRKT